MSRIFVRKDEMSSPLQGDQYPKGLTEEQVRTIAREEAANAFKIFKDEVGIIHVGADGNINGRDFFQIIERTEQTIRPKIEDPPLE